MPTRVKALNRLFSDPGHRFAFFAKTKKRRKIYIRLLFGRQQFFHLPVHLISQTQTLSPGDS